MSERSRDVRRSAEYSAKTVEDALRKAAEDFHVLPGQLQYEIIKDSTHTILGLVRTGEVTILVWEPAPLPIVEEAEEEEYEESVEEEPEEPAEAEALPLMDEETEEELELKAAHPPSKGNPPELETIAQDVVSTLLDKMGILAAVEVADRGGKIDAEASEVSPLVLNIVGDDLGMLIGRRGETLRDLQFIARLIVSRRLGAWPNVVIDVESYKAKRVTALRSLATRMADQVRRTRQPVVLEPMPAHERRTIHLALRNDPDVYTESTGEDQDRKVQILPKKK